MFPASDPRSGPNYPEFHPKALDFRAILVHMYIVYLGADNPREVWFGVDNRYGQLWSGVTTADAWKSRQKVFAMVTDSRLTVPRARKT